MNVVGILYIFAEEPEIPVSVSHIPPGTKIWGNLSWVTSQVRQLSF